MDPPATVTAGLVTGYVVFLLVWYVFGSIGLMGVFAKAGERPVWAAFVPFWNVWMLIRLTGRPPWYLAIFVGGIVLDFVPIIGIFAAVAVAVFQVFLLNSLSRSFGRTTGFTVGLFFLFPVFVWILWLGSARYLGRAAAPGFSGNGWASPQPGYPPPYGQPGYPPPYGGYPPSAGGYPPPYGGYPPPAGGYPPGNGGYAPSAGGYPTPAAGYPPPTSGGYPPPVNWPAPGDPPPDSPPAQSPPPHPQAPPPYPQVPPPYPEPPQRPDPPEPGPPAP